MKNNLAYPIKSLFCLLAELMIFSFLLSFLFCHSALLPDTSKLYSTSLAHRLQTDALLKGHLSLSPMPFGYLRDFLWSPHGLQQPWGLGVPLLRLPFEWLALKWGMSPFPDRIVLLFYFFLTILVLNLSLRSVFSKIGFLHQSLLGLLLRWYFIYWVFISPAFGSLIQERINTVYHETLFYDYLYSYFLLAIFWMYMAKPRRGVFIFLGAVSGFAWVVSPPLLAYGMTTVVLCSVAAYQDKAKLSLIIGGFLCFILGVMINLWFNYLRFGSPLEFGHTEILGGIPILDFSLRFGYPFSHEPFWCAAKELIGIMFFHNAWQSDTVRFRWGFVGANPPFNAAYIMIFMLAVIYAVFSLLRAWAGKVTAAQETGFSARVIRFSLIWGFINFGMLFIFYLRVPFMNSNYLSEFSAAFNALFVALIIVNLEWIKSRRRENKFLPSILFIFLLIFIFYAANMSFLKINNRIVKKYNQGVITKIKLYNADFPRGDYVLNELIMRGVVDNISADEVRLKFDYVLNAQDIYQIAGKDFGLIWFILTEARFGQLTQPQLTDKKGINDLLLNFEQGTHLSPPLPDNVSCGHADHSSGLMFQFNGWDTGTDCWVSVVSSAFLPSRRCLALNYTIQTLSLKPHVKVKRDLDFLKLRDSRVSQEKMGKSSWTQVTRFYCGDTPVTNTPALYSIAWISPDQLTKVNANSQDRTLPIKLNWIKVFNEEGTTGNWHQRSQ